MLPTSQPTAQKPFRGRRDGATLYTSLELSQATWLVTPLSPGSEKMSKYSTPGGDSAALLGLLRRLQVKAEQIAGGPVNVMVIQEAGLDGFWVHRLLEANGIESHVVDPALIAVSRRRRRAKTDAIDDETLVRTLLAWRAGSHASARWSYHRRRSRRIAGAPHANAPFCCRRACGTSTASRVCSPVRGAPIMSRCTKIVGHILQR
jgi:hypothetical protein